MFICSACRFTESREDLVEEVFCIGGEYVLVRGIPSTVCVRCGEMSFSAETVERVRVMARGDSAAVTFIPTKVLEFAQ